MSDARPDPFRTRWLPRRVALLALVVAWMALLLFVPLGSLGVGVWTFGPLAVLDQIGEAGGWPALGRTVVVAIVSVVLNGVVGVAGAITLVRHRFWGRRLLDMLVDLPLAVSPVMTGLAFLLVFGRGGLAEPLLSALGWKITFAFPSLVLATVFVTLPFVLREVSHVLVELGTDEEAAAATLGASSRQTFWRITLPNIRHGLTYGSTLTLARALGEFGAVLVVGGAIEGRTDTATTFIFTAVDERHEPAAYGMALILAALSMAFLVVLERLKRRQARET
ncbi:MAG: sulfate ABC transporter permease subunit [Deltaproteobacteria bacterium]|nr:sulfate ABC transporter permease subunit [Deltaproteobacteria bacterium]